MRARVLDRCVPWGASGSMEHRVWVQSEPSEVAVKGSTTGRGYGYDHQRVRAKLAPWVATGEAVCARCGEFIAAGVPWDLGHTVDRRSYTGPEHRRCNRREGAVRGNRARRSRRRSTSLEW